MRSLLDELIANDTASVFALTAADWAMTSQIYSNIGFKVTARLTDHIVRAEDYVGVTLWHKRVGGSASPRLPSFK